VTGDRELESILLAPFPCGTSPCVDPIFGPTAPELYWSATTTPANADDAWFVYFGPGNWGNDGKGNQPRAGGARDAKASGLPVRLWSAAPSTGPVESPGERAHRVPPVPCRMVFSGM
jgi:hypothetical protein